MRKLFIPTIYQDPWVNPEGLLTQWVTFENFVMGMRITFKRSKFTNNTDELTKNAMPQFRQDYYSEAGREHVGEDKEPFNGMEYQEGGGYKGKGGYVLYFPPTIKAEEAENLYMSKLVVRF